MKENFGLSDNNSLVIFRKTGDGCHKFLFNTTQKRSSILNFYLTNLPLLEKFCDHFLKEWELEKSTTEKFSVNIANLIGPAFLLDNIVIILLVIFVVHHANEYLAERDEKKEVV